MSIPETKEFSDVNPQEFMLRILAPERQAEPLLVLPNAKWVPRIGEKMILPVIPELYDGDSKWDFEVEDISYDFIEKTVDVYVQDLCFGRNEFFMSNAWRESYP